MLQLRPNCECCNCDLQKFPASTERMYKPEGRRRAG